MSSLWNSLQKKARAVNWFWPIPTATAFAGVIILLLWVFSGWYGGAPGEILRGIYIEAGGAVMDIVIFGVILALLAAMTSRHQDVTRQLELIDDYKKWDSAEARYRIAGAIRRLNKLNRTAINFSGIEISDFRFAGSTFYDGSWGSVQCDGPGQDVDGFLVASTAAQCTRPEPGQSEPATSAPSGA